MGRGHSPSAYVHHLQNRLFPVTKAADTTDDGHVGPVMVGTREGLVISDDDPIPPAFWIAGARRQLRPVILIEGTILHVQPEGIVPRFFLHDDRTQHHKLVVIGLGGTQPTRKVWCAGPPPADIVSV